MSSSHKSIFLDANIFLHYQTFDQIDWLTLLGSEKVQIVIPPVTIRELNKQKELHPHQRIRGRAEKVLRKLSVLLTASNPSIVAQNIKIFLEDREPSVNFHELGLQKEIQDDYLVASILFFQNENPHSETVLVTSDNGLLLTAKAKRLHINTLILSDDQKLPEESDSQQRRIKELEEQLLRLKSASPALSLTFEDGNDFASFVVAAPIVKQSDYFDTHLTALIEKYPKMKKQTLPSDKNLSTVQSFLLSQLAGSMQTSITDESIDEYNKNLDEYFKSYRAFLEEELLVQNRLRRTVRLRFFLSNDGTTPAEDIDVNLHFPNGFALYRRNQLPKSPPPPTPPEKPKPEFMRLFDASIMHNIAIPPSLNFPKLPPPPGNVSPFRIRPSKSFDVDFHVNRLKHNIRESIDPLFVIFDSYDATKSFNIQCRILAGNIPQPIDQQLHVIIKNDLS